MDLVSTIRQGVFSMIRFTSLTALLLGLYFILPGEGMGGAVPSVGTGEVFFSPDGGVTDAIVREIGTAKEQVLVQAYSFTSAPIAEALVKAKKRGLKVEAVLDHSNRSTKYSGATFLRNQDIPVWVDERHAIAHNKVILIDQDTVITGSFNFTRNAEENNAENLLLIKGNIKLAELYRVNYDAHKAHSDRY
jgi:phosphatidylserine/phosphatidylglycerophosphate/cardiolipin synthase-like enzyme